MPELVHFQASDPLPDLLEGLEEAGVVVVENLLDADALTRLGRELAPYLEAADPAMEHAHPMATAFYGDKTRHVAALASKSKSFASDVLCHPLLLGICDAILLPSCGDYLLNLGHLMDRGPGAEAQVIHRDELVWSRFVPQPAPTLQVATMIALDPFTRSNGATEIVPGSHRWEVDREPDEGEVATAVMPPGAAVVYLGSTLHRGGTNSTADARRRGLHVSYVVGWLRTEENNVLATRPEIARTLPAKAQELLGYGLHDGYAGMVEMTNPMELLNDGRL